MNSAKGCPFHLLPMDNCYMDRLSESFFHSDRKKDINSHNQYAFKISKYCCTAVPEVNAVSSRKIREHHSLSLSKYGDPNGNGNGKFDNGKQN